MGEEDYLMMSGLQHFDFCRRQWALIHIEQQWNENYLTAEGRLDHKKAHDDKIVEKRKDIIIMRGLRVVSHELQLIGECDVVEFYRDIDGIELNRYEGKWIPVPVEYKHGHSKTIDADRLQLCAQAIALEEMFVCDIEYGFLYYCETRKREKVIFDDDLRNKVIKMAKEMVLYFQKGHTPKARMTSKCKSCSLIEICIPSIMSKKEVCSYIDNLIKE